jgi:RHS repeat-associated protein
MPDDSTQYYHYDSLGSTVALTDATQAISDKYEYDEFGNISNSEGTTANPFKYVGRFGVMDEGDGLQYMRARYYDAEVGKFLNKDKLQGDLTKPLELNRYAYVMNNPVRFIDVTGFSAKEGGAFNNQPINSSDVFHNIETINPFTKFMVPEIIQKIIVQAARFREIDTSIAPYVRITKFLKRWSPWLDLLSLGTATFESSIDLRYEILANPEISTLEAFSLASGELTAIPLNIITAPGRALGKFLIDVGCGGDEQFKNDFYQSEILGIKLESILNRVSGRQVVDVTKKILDKPTDWLGNKFYEWGWY